MLVTPMALLLAGNVEDLGADTLQQEIDLQRERLSRLYEAGAHLAPSGHDGRVTALRGATYLFPSPQP